MYNNEKKQIKVYVVSNSKRICGKELSNAGYSCSGTDGLTSIT